MKETITVKTALIFNTSSRYIKYLILDGDYRKYDGVYINTLTSDFLLQEELGQLLMLNEGNFVSLEDFQRAIVKGAYLIEVGLGMPFD